MDVGLSAKKNAYFPQDLERDLRNRQSNLNNMRSNLGRDMRQGSS